MSPTCSIRGTRVAWMASECRGSLHMPVSTMVFSNASRTWRDGFRAITGCLANSARSQLSTVNTTGSRATFRRATMTSSSATWVDVLGRLRLRAVAADKPTFSTLYRASAPTSPIRLLLQSVREETALDLPRTVATAPGEAGEPAKKPTDAAAVPEDSGFANPTAANTNPSGKEIALYFQPLNNLVAGEPGSQPIDSFIAELAAIYTKLLNAAQTERPEQGAGEILDQVMQLKAKAEALPKPASTWFMQVADDIAAEVTDASIGQLSQIYSQQVAKSCTEMLANRYPFSPNSNQDVLMKDFSTMFQPGGIFDKFFTEHLDRLVDRSGDVWTWRQGSRLAAGLSPESLNQFQRAAEIRDTFFTAGAEPSVSLTVTPAMLGPGVDRAVLKINSSVIEATPGVNMSVPVEWPGAQPDNHAAIALQSGSFGQQVPLLERRGPWALFRLLDQASLQRSGDALTASFVVQGLQVAYDFNVEFRPKSVGSLLAAGFSLPGWALTGDALRHVWQAACKARLHCDRRAQRVPRNLGALDSRGSFGQSAAAWRALEEHVPASPDLAFLARRRSVWNDSRGRIHALRGWNRSLLSPDGSRGCRHRSFDSASRDRPAVRVV